MVEQDVTASLAGLRAEVPVVPMRRCHVRDTMWRGIGSDQDQSMTGRSRSPCRSTRGVLGQRCHQAKSRRHHRRTRAAQHAEVLVELADGVTGATLEPPSEKARSQHRRPHQPEYQEDHDRREPLDLPSNVTRFYEMTHHDRWIVGTCRCRRRALSTPRGRGLRPRRPPVPGAFDRDRDVETRRHSARN